VKYSALHEVSIANLPWQNIQYKAPDYLFIQKDAEVEEIYKKGFSINGLFPLSSSGIKTHRDHFVIDIDKETLAKRIQHFYDLSVSDDDIKREMDLKDNRDWNLSQARKIGKFDASFIEAVTYRPFDNQTIYYDANLIDFGRQNVMRHMLAGENVGFITARSNKSQSCDHFFITKNLMEIKSGESTVLSAIFPLYVFPDATDLLAEATRTPNLNISIVNEIAQGLGLTFTPEKTDAANSFAPVDLLDYIYAVLHSPSYRETYKEFLKIDFPRVPYPKEVSQFWQLVALGGELRQLHLLEGAVINQLITSYPESGSNLVDKPRYDDGKVYINDTQYFDGVPQLAWEFYIGGYQPAQKWLKDRKGRILVYEDILHYQKIIKAMVETDRLMQAIDQLGAL
jgi:predicted helicase